MLWLLSLVLAFVCFKLGALTVLLSFINYALQVLILGLLIVAIFVLFRWWRNRPRWR